VAVGSSYMGGHLENSIKIFKHPRNLPDGAECGITVPLDHDLETWGHMIVNPQP